MAEKYYYCCIIITNWKRPFSILFYSLKTLPSLSRAIDQNKFRLHSYAYYAKNQEANNNSSNRHLKKLTTTTYLWNPAPPPHDRKTHTDDEWWWEYTYGWNELVNRIDKLDDYFVIIKWTKNKNKIMFFSFLHIWHQ
jgi:hypothetical protein